MKFDKDIKKKFWEIIKKPKKTSNDLIVSSVDTTNKTVTVTADPNISGNSMYYIQSSSYTNVSSRGGGGAGGSGQILYYSGSTPTWAYPQYQLSDGEETITVSHEEYYEAIKIGMKHIVKKRQYKDEFEGLLK